MSPELRRVISPEAAARIAERAYEEAQNVPANELTLFAVARSVVVLLPLIYGVGWIWGAW